MFSVIFGIIPYIISYIVSVIVKQYVVLFMYCSISSSTPWTPFSATAQKSAGIKFSCWGHVGSAEIQAPGQGSFPGCVGVPGHMHQVLDSDSALLTLHDFLASTLGSAGSVDSPSTKNLPKWTLLVLSLTWALGWLALADSLEVASTAWVSEQTGTSATEVATFAGSEAMEAPKLQDAVAAGGVAGEAGVGPAICQCQLQLPVTSAISEVSVRPGFPWDTLVPQFHRAIAANPTAGRTGCMFGHFGHVVPYPYASHVHYQVGPLQLQLPQFGLGPSEWVGQKVALAVLEEAEALGLQLVQVVLALSSLLEVAGLALSYWAPWVYGSWLQVGQWLMMPCHLGLEVRRASQ